MEDILDLGGKVELNGWTLTRNNAGNYVVTSPDGFVVYRTAEPFVVVQWRFLSAATKKRLHKNDRNEVD